MSVYTIGEALIDFMPEGAGFVPAVGGAPANVAACVARLGGKAHFIGKVGDDLFGSRIASELAAAGVDLTFFGKSDRANTALAFVSLKENGEREFAFYRKPSADMFLDPADVRKIPFGSDDMLHFCSVDLIDMPVKYATAYAIEQCKGAGGTVSFDPNIRKNLWNDWTEYRKVINEFLLQADIVKLADDECDFIFGNSDPDAAARKLLSTAKQVIITCGAKGSRLYTAEGVTEQKPYPVRAIDTTGAGDTFIGTYLRYYKERGSAAALELASAASAMVCTKKGVLCSLPTEAELNAFMGAARHA